MEPCEARLIAVGEIATATRCDPGAGALRSKAGCEWGDQACLLLELKLAMAMELAMHYFVRSGVGACEARLTTVADLAIFRLAGPGAGACEAKLSAVADLAMHYFMRPGAEACVAKLAADA